MNEVLLRPVRAFALGVATGLAVVAAMAPAGAQAAEPWGFEQVTPVNKGAGSVSADDTFQTRADGNGFLLTSISDFAGAPAESIPLYTRYFASRGADGWGNRPLDPPTDSVPPNSISHIMNVVGASTDLSHVLVASTRALTPGATADGGNLYMRNTATGAYTLVATSEDITLARLFVANQGALSVKYVAPDGRSALFSTAVPLVPGAPDGTETGQEFALYSWTAEEGVRAVSVLPDSEGGAIVTGITAVGGDGDSGNRNAYPDSDGLDHIYFSRREGDGGYGPAYVRSGDETKAVSVSRIPGADSDPVPAMVWATGRGGRFMLFSTAGPTPLTSDTPTELSPSGDYLYRYDAVNDSLTYIGARTPFKQPVIQMSQDGQTIAFLSGLALTPDAPDFDWERLGDDNIYVWRDGVLRLVSHVDAGSVPTDAALYLRVLSSDGRYLAFTDNSTGPLSAASIAGVDIGSASADCPRGVTTEPAVCDQVFVFDADADELECASCPDAAPKGKAGDSDLQTPGYVRMGMRQVQTVADDGTVFFTSPESLVEADVNGLADVYAYRDGERRLVSRASQGMNARFLDATPDGRTVFFATNDPIAPTDNDKAIDVYMTREGAGFPYTPPIVVPPCTGGDCRDPFTPVEGLPLAGSVAFTGSGNVRPGGARLSVAGGKSIVGTAGRLRVKVPGQGRVTVSGAGVRTVKRAMSRAGTYTVRVALTAKARKALRKSKSARQRVRVRVTFNPADGRASRLTLALTYKSKPANKKGR